MKEILELIQERHSTRMPFKPNRPVPKEKLKQIIEAGRWAPTPHNMQNFDIILIDDKKILETIGNIKFLQSEEFIRENFELLSLSEEELLKKKVGILGSSFPPKWRDASKLDDAVRERVKSPLSYAMKGAPTILIVIYDSRKRAPASEGDMLGILSLGCLMENMWLMAQSLGISFQIMSVFNSKNVVKELRKILHFPEYMEVSYAVRLGYPAKSVKFLRVRREKRDFVHHNRYGNMGLD